MFATCGLWVFYWKVYARYSPHTQYSTLYLRALGTSHCIAVAGNGKRIKPLPSLFLFFRCCPWLGGVGVVVWVLYTYALCTLDVCIFPAYYHTLRYIYASPRMNIPYNIHLSLNAILPLFPANVEISMLVPFFKLFL